MIYYIKHIQIAFLFCQKSNIWICGMNTKIQVNRNTYLCSKNYVFISIDKQNSHVSRKENLINFSQENLWQMNYWETEVWVKTNLMMLHTIIVEICILNYSILQNKYEYLLEIMIWRMVVLILLRH